MNINDYSTELQKLITAVREEQNTTGRNFQRLLAALKKAAVTEGDHALMGFVYFNYAGSALDRGDHPKVFSYCKKALTELLRSSDRDLTALTYDIFALEAHRLGCLDVAQQYYNIAQSFVGEEDAPLMSGIIETNIGVLHADMEEYSAAFAHDRKSISCFRKCEKDDTIPRRISIVTMGLAMHLLYGEKTEDARRIHKRAETLIRKHGLDTEEINQWLLLLRAEVAFANNEEEEADKYLEMVIQNIVSKPDYSMYCKKIYWYCRMMIKARDWKKAGDLLDAMSANINEDSPAYDNFRLAQLKIDYARAMGDRKKLHKAYEDRNDYYEQYQEDRNLIYHESIVLMDVTGDLHREHTRIHQENARLLKIAETDMLTGVPNRYAMNRELEAAFERASVSGTRFGIGIVDIDEFKLYNDVNGHQAGDECLQKVAAALNDIAEEHDIFLARYGGDEFVLIYEGMEDADIILLEKEMARRLPAKASHGFYNAVLTEESRPWDFFARSDKALYAAKKKR